MFDKFRKRGTKKSSKSKIKGYSLDGYGSVEVLVHHASPTTTVLAPAVAPPISAAVELLPPVREVAVSERSSVILRKIQLCCNVYGYSDNLKWACEREIKRQTLDELLDIIQYGSLKFDELMQEQLIGMVSVNIFRCLPPSYHENTGTETVNPEEDERYLDLLWPHL